MVFATSPCLGQRRLVIVIAVDATPKRNRHLLGGEEVHSYVLTSERRKHDTVAREGLEGPTLFGDITRERCAGPHFRRCSNGLGDDATSASLSQH